MPVCNIFKEVILEGQLCYQADVEKLKEKMDREHWEKEKDKIRTSGFMLMLDYNEDRSLDMALNDKDEELKVNDKTMDSTILQKKSQKRDDKKPLIYLETIGETCQRGEYFFLKIEKLPDSPFYGS